MDKTKIFVDPGHGGSDPGAVANGIIEKSINLIVGIKLKELLIEKGFDVKLSRETDVFLSLSDRCKLANEWGADYFISVHHNAGFGDGWEVIHTIHTKQSEGDELAEAIGKEFTKLGQNMRRMFSRESTKYPGTDYYTVINKTRMPAVITEFAFLDTQDHKAVDTVEELYAEAAAICRGVCNYLGVGSQGWKTSGIDILAAEKIILDPNKWKLNVDTWMPTWAVTNTMAQVLGRVKAIEKNLRI